MKQPDGSGRVQVRSGWISYRVGWLDVLVPAGFELRFDAARAYTPVRPYADAAFVAAVDALDQALTRSGLASVDAQAAAAAAADADGYTLLSLLSQHPALADGPLYPRLAVALGTNASDEEHRAAWLAGDIGAINAWWQRLPVQPKTWWANWKDAFR